MDVVPDPDELDELDAGQRLHLEHFRARGLPRGTVVVVHGFSSHCGLYRHVGTALAAEGFGVTSFDCRGHGRSDGRRGHVARFAHFTDDLRAVVERARTRHGSGPLVLLGHSHGATVVLDYALRPAPQAEVSAARLVLAAPFLALAMRVPPYKRLLARPMSYLWPTLTMHNGVRGPDVSREPRVLEGFDRDPLVHHAASARWFTEVRDAQKRIHSRAKALSIPALMLLAGADRVVDNEAALAFAAAAPAVEVRRFEKLYHELFLEPERQEVIDAIAGWLRDLRPSNVSVTLPP